MRFSCHKADLLSAVQIVSRVLPTQTSEPIFTNILLAAEPERLSLFATQHQISIRKEMPMVVAEPGRVAVPGALLAEILQQIQTVRAEAIEIAAAPDRRITVSAEGAVYRLSGVEASGFPAMSEPSGDRAFVVPAGRLRDLIRRVVFVSSGGGGGFGEMLIEVADGKLAFVATDSVRLAAATCPLAEASSPLEVKLPLASVAELGKILPAEGEVRVTVGSHQVGFAFASTAYVARTSEKIFPNYRSILPKDHARYLTVETRSFADALKGVAPLARANKHRVRLCLEAGHVKVCSSSQEVGGEAEREIEAVLQGEPIELSFNARYILDFLACTDAERVRMGATAPSLPATFRPEENSDEYVYLLMPINL